MWGGGGGGVGGVWHQPHTTKRTAAGHPKPFSLIYHSAQTAPPYSLNSPPSCCAMTYINLQGI